MKKIGLYLQKEGKLKFYPKPNIKSSHMYDLLSCYHRHLTYVEEKLTYFDSYEEITQLVIDCLTILSDIYKDSGLTFEDIEDGIVAPDVDRLYLTVIEYLEQFLGFYEYTEGQELVEGK